MVTSPRASKKALYRLSHVTKAHNTLILSGSSEGEDEFEDVSCATPEIARRQLSYNPQEGSDI